MILELDAGNTRIKWRLRKRNAANSQWLNVAEGFVNALERTPSVFIELGKQLEKLPMENISRMLVASVRGEGFKTAFSSLMTEKWHLQPEFAASSKQCLGVVNSYVDVSKLGVDRWLAIIAAHHKDGEACCVVDCGTAIKVDLVSKNGQHRGGYIVPGLQLSLDALASRSKALATDPADWSLTEPGNSTISAVRNGILRCVLGFIRDIRLQSINSGILHRWYLTGGDAIVLLPHLNWEIQYEPDLVLEGLELVMFPPSEYEVVG